MICPAGTYCDTSIEAVVQPAVCPKGYYCEEGSVREFVVDPENILSFEDQVDVAVTHLCQNQQSLAGDLDEEHVKAGHTPFRQDCYACRLNEIGRAHV